MDYKKRYNELIDAIKEMMEANPHDGGLQNLVQDNVPELAESEDEKVRKWLIDTIKSVPNDSIEWDIIDKSDVLAWLEKQGEKNSTDKVEPKFNAGNWIVWQDKCYKVNYNGCGYELVDQNGLSTSLEYGTIDENAHLWSIEDAKDGDVLYSPHCKLLWLYKNKQTCYVGNNLNYHSDSIVVNNPICIPIDARPATKEQRDTLFAKMKEESYEWNAEKKELNKVES